jgi:hypothetical protein
MSRGSDSLLFCQSGVWAKQSGGGGIGRYQCSAQALASGAINGICIDTSTGNAILSQSNNGWWAITYGGGNWPTGWNESNTMCSTFVPSLNNTFYAYCGNTTTAKQCFKNIYQTPNAAWTCI